MPRDLLPEEEEAARIVEAFLPGVKVSQHDDGTQPKMYDLALTWPDGRVASMEVTTNTSPELLRATARVTQEATAPAHAVSRWWYVSLGDGADPRDVRRRVDGYLARLERDGINRFFKHTPAAIWPPAVAAIRRDLRIDVAISGDPSDKPAIYLAPPGRDHGIDPELLLTALEEEARLNADKLALASTAERHLFVWVDHKSDAWGVMLMLEPPPGIPELPDSISHIWVAAKGLHGGLILWRAHRSGPWVELSNTLWGGPIRR